MTKSGKILAAMVISAASAMAQVAAPTTQSAAPMALPSGHPDIAGMMSGTGSGAGPMSLPSGHPDIAKMSATTAPIPTGTLTIHEVQGTKGAAAAGADPIVIEVYGEGQLIKQLNAKFDASGAANVGEVPMGAQIEQLIKVTHSGVEYVTLVPPAEKNEKVQKADVTVYETTDQMPAWNIKMWHMMTQPTEGGVSVQQIMQVTNPADRAWTGKAVNGKREVFAIQLPAGAHAVQLSGEFREGNSVFDANRVVNTQALIPGETQYSIEYFVPAVNGKTELTMVPPAMVNAMMVLLPDDGSSVAAEGLIGPQKAPMGGGGSRFLRGNGIAAGKQVKVTIGTPVAAAASAEGAAIEGAMDSAQIAKIAAGLGGLVIFVVGGLVMFTRGARNAKCGKANCAH